MQELTYTNPGVVKTIMKHEGVSQETAERRFRGALQFLEAAASSPTPISPSPAIDTAWHAFILHTRDYADYCHSRFGHFIHHGPTGEADPVKLSNGRSLAAEKFGALDEGVWNLEESTECGSTCDAIE